MVAWAAWEVPEGGCGEGGEVQWGGEGIRPIWGMNMGFVIDLHREGMRMRERVLRGRRAFGE